MNRREFLKRTGAATSAILTIGPFKFVLPGENNPRDYTYDLYTGMPPGLVLAGLTWDEVNGYQW